MSSERMFGTDGIRDLVGTSPINPRGSERLGMATGRFYDLAGKNVLIAHDGRASGDELTESFAHGLLAVGANVELLGAFPTPGLALRTRDSDAEAGVMITASHNLHLKDDPTQRYNGIKILGAKGDKLTDDDEDAIQSIYEGNIRLTGVRGKLTSGSREEHRAAYIDHLVSTIDSRQVFAGMRVGLDMAHGATAGFAQELVTRLGAHEIVTIGDAPNGWNINDKVGATHLAPLKKLVVGEGLDVGAGFDGDGDRVFMVTPEEIDGAVVAQEFDGDNAVYTNAIGGGHKHAAVTTMTNGGIRRDMVQSGIQVTITDVGDRYVLKAMRDTEGSDNPVTIGGEQSGHVINPKVGPTGDGMGTFINTMDIVQRSGDSLTAWRTRSEASRIPSRLVSVRVQDKAAAMKDEELLEFKKQAEAAAGEFGGVSLRQSGTGAEVRLYIEGDDQSKLDEIADGWGAKTQAKYGFPTE